MIIRFILLAILCLTSAYVPTHSLAQEKEARSDEDIRKIVRDYLLKNPEIIMEAIGVLERRRVEEQRIAQSRLVETHKDAIYKSKHHFVVGNPDGDVTLVEFFDYNCGYCRQSLETMEKLLATDPNLKVVFKEFPVLGEDSLEASRVAVAAGRLDLVKYLELHKKLLSARGTVDGRIAMMVAKSVGFKEEDLRAEMQKPTVGGSILSIRGLAGRLGINGTPSFIIGDEIVPGAISYDELAAKIVAVRNCGKTVCS